VGVASSPGGGRSECVGAERGRADGHGCVQWETRARR